MNRQWLLVFCISLFSIGASAQDLSGIQIHGFATQGFLYSSANHYLSTNSENGSLAWTDGAVSVSDSVSDKLRVGLQLHIYQLGQFGGSNLQIDWATGDYKMNEFVGFRAGKFKLPLGLYNDSQDVDAVHLWALLPQSVYPTDNKSFTLSALGGEFYGSRGLGKKAGALIYRGYAGYRPMDLSGGYVTQMNEQLVVMEQLLQLPSALITTPPAGNVYGGDVRWQTPLKGLLVGASAMAENLKGSAGAITFILPSNTMTQEYAKYERGRFMVAAEVKRQPVRCNILVGGQMLPPIPIDFRSWYAMTSYRLTDRFQIGTYYSHFVDAGGGANTSLSANYAKDWTISSRFDFNSYFYAKLEEHFVHGTDQSLYTEWDPTPKSRTNVLAAKVGFSF